MGAEKITLKTVFTEMTKRFNRVDEKFDRIDERFAGVDDRFEMVKQEFALVRGDIDRIDSRLDHVETRFTLVDANLIRLGTRLSTKIDDRFSELRNDIADIKVELVGKIGAQKDPLNDHELRIGKLEVPTN
jgi:archaellum component FlaC